MRLFRKKGITLKIRYTDTIVEPAYLPTRSSTYKPDWYKDLPQDLVPNEGPNARKCPAIVYGLSSGFLIYLPFDVVVEMDGSQFKMYAGDSKFEVDYHRVEQVGKAFKEDKTILKLYMPFSAECTEDIPFAYSYPAMHNLPFTNTVSGPYGEIDFKYTSSMHCFLFIRNPPEGSKKQIVLKRGMPIAQLVPLTERRVELELENTLGWQPRTVSHIPGVSSYFDIKSHIRRISS